MEKGWQNASEVNRVIYDPKLTGLPQLEERLKNAGTYIRTLPDIRNNE